MGTISTIEVKTMTEQPHSPAGHMEQPALDTEHGDVQGFGGGAGVNPSFGRSLLGVQPFGGHATGGDFASIARPFGCRGGLGGEVHNIAVIGPLAPTSL